MKKPPLIVVKLGTSSITDSNNQLDKAKMLNIVRQIVKLREKDIQVILVSSGAVAAGKKILPKLSSSSTVRDKQCLAAVGQCELIDNWKQLFAIYQVIIGQILLTKSTIEDRERFINVRDTFKAMLEHGVVPIVNENDSIATSEIKVGDNDNLAAITAIVAQASKVILLTDQDGLFTADPSENPTASLIKEIEQLNDEVLKMATGSSTKVGTGGMLTKLKAAELAARSGITTIIAASQEPQIVARLMDEEEIGTKILAKKDPIEVRKQWILSAIKAGTVQIDDGAKQALVQKGASLLSAGVIKISGEFSRGDVIEIIATDERLLGYGVTNYSNSDLERIKGIHSEQILHILGYDHAEVVHRDNMVINTD